MKRLAYRTTLALAAVSLALAGCGDDDGKAECGNGVLEGNETCDASEFGNATCVTLGFTTGTLLCSNDCQNILTTNCCTDQCATDGQVTCNGTVLQTCEVQANGCLGLTVYDCANDGDICDAGQIPAVCAAGCTSNCTTVDELRCNNNDVEICAVVGQCNEWQLDTTCGASAVCMENDTLAECITRGTGETCADAAPITVPYTVSGANFQATFADDLTFSGTDCGGHAGGPEVVYTLLLNANDTVVISETGNFSNQILVMDTCDAAGACLARNITDLLEPNWIRFTAPADGQYFVVVESTYPSSGSTEYEIHFSWPESDCSDAADNDHNGLVDCHDPSCFGLTGCTTETHCKDGVDNDSDGGADCADTNGDCDSTIWCQPKIALFEQFGIGSEPDVDGCTIQFTWDATTYTHSVPTCVATGLPITPGTGAVATTTLPTANDAAWEYTLQGSWTFEFYGRTYSSFWVGSNGFITFSEGDSSPTYITSTFFLLPRIAGYAADLSTDYAGEITVDEFSDHVVISFVDVEEYNFLDTVTFQIVLHQDGTFEIHYDTINIPAYGYIGVANGGSVGADPGPTDLVVLPPG